MHFAGRHFRQACCWLINNSNYALVHVPGCFRNPTDVAGRMLVFVVVAVLSSLLGYNLPDLAYTIARRVNILYTVISIYMLMPYLFMSLFVSDKRFYLQGEDACTFLAIHLDAF